MKAPERILIYRLGFLGDMVVSLPCFHFIRSRFSKSRITLLSDEPVSNKAAPASAVLENSGLCDEFMAYPNGLRDRAKLFELRSQIARRRFDLAINLAAARGLLKACRDDIFLRCCGIARVVGTPWQNRDLTPHTIAEGYYEPESERLVRRLRSLGKPDTASRTSWALNLVEAERQAAESLLENLKGDFLAVSVGSKLAAKDWGEDNWRALIRLLGNELPGVSLVLLGAPSESERSETLKGCWPGHALNLCGLTSPRIAAAVLARSRQFIGHDSGPMHLAAASGAPTLGIFSWNNPPGQWFPGHQSWNSIQTLYPPLPAGGWKPALKEKRGAAEGILLLQPAEVCAAALNLWRASEAARDREPIRQAPATDASAPRS